MSIHVLKWPFHVRLNLWQFHAYISFPHSHAPGLRSRHSAIAKGYIIIKNTLRKGLFLCFLYVLDIGKKGSLFKECQWFRKKTVFF